MRPGELTAIRARLRNVAANHDLTTVIASAFDRRTRILPFVFAGPRIVPAGVRAIGSAMVDAGFEKTRIVLQQWNRNFLPSQMRLDGRVPDMFMVSSMQIHWGQCEGLIREASRIDPADRPLIIAGGPKVIYQPWEAFSADPDDPWGADVAVTGEEYVLLNLLEVLLSERAPGEPLRAAFVRARDSGALDEIPGLVYARGGEDGVAEELVDTGIQRLAGDLDELPHPILGYRLIEPPGKGPTLSSRALPPERIRRCTPVVSLVLTLGCSFSCPYCPIPAYNQRQFRYKSGARIADEMVRVYEEYGIRYFFGTDDNFFNDKDRALEIVQTLADTKCDGKPIRHRIRWGTEATVHDTLRMKEHLRFVRRSGIRALWIGVEDMTGALVKKGQTVDKTTEAFRLLRERGISPMAMMMHHDEQPLYTRGEARGLLNQVKLLRKAGAVDMQVLMIIPAMGSKLHDEAFTSGLAYESVGKKRVEPYMFDGNYVVASGLRKPWRKQLNIIAAYLYFYNPLRFLISLVRPKSGVYLLDCGVQLIGMFGLAKTVRRTLGWTLRLMWGKIKRHSRAPGSRIPMRSSEGGRASHALEGAPTPEFASVES